LKLACLSEARALISEKGLDSLSIREVARRLHVSHQAPYKHFPSRDHLLAEVIRDCFLQFKEHLNAAPITTDPQADLAMIGRHYLEYALSNPLEYQLMFALAWPAASEYPDLRREARHAFDVLRNAFLRLHNPKGSEPAINHDRVELDALFVWSCMHGIAGLMRTNILKNLELRPLVLETAVSHMMNLMRAGLTSAA
jgi:AcrR family transcriptional regulator